MCDTTFGVAKLDESGGDHGLFDVEETVVNGVDGANLLWFIRVTEGDLSPDEELGGMTCEPCFEVRREGVGVDVFSGKGVAIVFDVMVLFAELIHDHVEVKAFRGRLIEITGGRGEAGEDARFRIEFREI